MSEVTAKRPLSTGEKIILCVVRGLTAPVLCALIMAVTVTAIARIALGDESYGFDDVAILSIAGIPFTLGGFVVCGVPAIYLLKRLKAESTLNYAFAGAVTGSLWGYIIAPMAIEFLLLSALYGTLSALLWWGLRVRS